MKKEIVFSGAGVAIVTPFSGGKVDYKSFGELIEYQIRNKTDAIVCCATTGESATLSEYEHREIIDFTVERVGGRVPVIAGTGSNNTPHAIEMSKYARSAGADAILVVTPYYNKTTPHGLVKHFTTVAEAAECPMIIYNVPSRTGCNIPLSVYRELCECENIVGVKEASGNLSQIAQIAAFCGDAMPIYSGNDDQIVPILSLGGKGVISVLSNVLPKETHDMCSLWFEGKTSESRDLQLRYLELCNALFYEVNPVPIKAAMERLGMCSGELRMPLCEMEPSNKEKLFAAMERAGLI